MSTTVLEGKTLYQWFIDDIFGKKASHIPSVAYIRVLGRRTYVFIEKEKRVQSQKLAPRAEVGILVGFEGHHIYRVYVSSRRKVIRTSHCRFDEGQGLITDCEEDRLTMPDLQAIRGDDRNQDVEDTGAIPSQETAISQDRLIFDNANDDADPNINPDDHFDLADEPQESFLSPAHEEDEAAVDLPPVTMGRKKGRPIGSKNKTYAAVPRTTRSGHAAYVTDELDEEFTAPKSRSRLTDELDEEFTAPKNRNGTHDFSFDNSYQDSNGEEDDDYVDEKVKNDKSAYHAALYTGAKSNPTDPETLEEAKASPDWPKWKAAISSEYRALRRKKTWTLMKRNQVPKGQKVLHGRLVFKKKSNKEGTLERFKV